VRLGELHCINKCTNFMWYRTVFLWGDLREGRKEVPLFGCAGRNMGTGWNLEVKNLMSFRRVRKITKGGY